MAMPVRVGIIGVGVMGAEHARLLSTSVAGSAVVAVHDADAARASLVAASCGAQVADDPFAMVADDDVDCVLVASADATHESFVLAAIAAGTPVLCEKPLAPDLDGCRRVVSAEVEAGRRLVGVGFMRRFDAGYVALRESVRAGAIGGPLVLHCVHRNAAAPGMTAEQRITSSAVHELDIVRWLVDAELVEVSAYDVAIHRDAERNPLLLVVRTSSGLLVEVEVFVGARYGYDVRCELVGETGSVTLDANPPTAVRSGGALASTVAGDWRDRFADAYRRELQEWIQAVREERPPMTASAWDGLAATAVADAAIRALRSGRREIIALDPRPALYA